MKKLTVKKEHIREIFKSFSNLNVLIIGDVMIDSYMWGKVNRISPEAPVPIVAVQKKEKRLGGAANVALNIQAMGANPILCSVIGIDYEGQNFMDLLKYLKKES
jgi:D-glycero-beta-D-manno-heptose-7-phosphate kinase